MKIDIILLAGGASRRFGSDKLTAIFEGKPLYQYALDALSAVQDCLIRVVTRNPELENAARSLGFSLVSAPPPEEGIAASIRAGVAASRQDAFLCFFVCDQPYFDGETFQRFLKAFSASGKPYGRVCAGNRMGSPAIFPPWARDELLALTGDEGGRRILQKKQEALFLYPVIPQLLRDFDTPWEHADKSFSEKAETE